MKSRAERRDSLQKSLDALRIQRETNRSRSRMLQEMQRDYEGFSKAVRLVMQEAKGGRLGQIDGPVSALIRTRDDFTVAIETALGAAMQNIVVGSEADGKAAIRFLKRCDGGRATFLPKSTIQGRALQERGLEQCPGFVGVAADLVEYDPAYTGVIGNLLGRIVLVENLDHAVEMARRFQNRFKIVTLDGQVMNPGGSMTGGSASKSAVSSPGPMNSSGWSRRPKSWTPSAGPWRVISPKRPGPRLRRSLNALPSRASSGRPRTPSSEPRASSARRRHCWAPWGRPSAVTAGELESLSQRAAAEQTRLDTWEAAAAAAEQELAQLESALEQQTQGQSALSRQAAESRRPSRLSGWK